MSLRVLPAVLLAACAASPSPAPSVADGEPRAAAPTEAPPEDVEEPTSDEGGTIPHFEDGDLVGRVTAEGAVRRGLTVLDLGQAWTPRVFEEASGAGRQPYRERFLQLADERYRGRRRDPVTRHLELYGIFPTFRVLAERLADEERHACHAAVPDEDDAAIGALTQALRPGADVRRMRRRARMVRTLSRRLRRVAARRDLESIDELSGDRRFGPMLVRLREYEPEGKAVDAVQAHLRCDGLLRRRARAGVLDAYTGQALREFQKRHMIISLAGRLDEVTRRALLTGSRELDFVSLLRVLRERVVGATGLLEDGSASNRWATVVGRRLELDDEFRWVDRLEPMPDGAPDRVSEATDAAARHLGWTTPEAAAAWLSTHFPEEAPAGLLVAVRLPPAPAYHGPHMNLRVEIDRGDVDYGFPYTDDGRRRGRRVVNRPTFVVYTRHDGRDIPLVRWNTTIGGWQAEVNPAGGVGLRYKESEVGPRVWRDVIASPAWLPPPSTPDDELLRRRGEGWAVNRSITGPGYNSAYGLAMVIHHRVRGDGSGERDWEDHGIRSHGSVNYRSILRGTSHGCHRLFNHLAVRLTSFLLAHRAHVVRGPMAARFDRALTPPTPEDEILGDEVMGDGVRLSAGPDEARTYRLSIDTRGYRYELTPPVPVEVLEGNVRGRPRRPLTGFYPLPETLRAEAEAAAAADPDPGAGG